MEQQDFEQLRQKFEQHRHTGLDSFPIDLNDILGTLAIIRGGTGATTASAARTNLGLGTTDTPQFAGLGLGTSLGSNEKLKISGQFYTAEYDNGNSGTSKTIDLANGNVQFLTLTGNCTLTISNGKAGARYILMLKQDATGSRTITWPSGIKWENNTAPTLTTTASKIDVIAFVYSGVDGNFLGSYSYNF